MNRFIFTCLFALFLFQICFEGIVAVNPCSAVDYNSIVDQVTTEVAKQLSKHYKIEALAGNDKIASWAYKPTLEFQITGPLTKNMLRTILITGTEEFLTAINSNEKLRPFLKKYPFPADEIDIDIRIVDKQEVCLYHPNIYLAAAHKGKLYFRTLDEENPFEYKTTEIEEYEEALKIVEHEKR